MSTTPRSLADIPMIELRKMLRATERRYGKNTEAARLLRRVIAKREGGNRK